MIISSLILIFVLLFFKRLRAQDIDQEVKERAISCMGQIIAHLGDSLQAELPSCLPMFLDRLKNEILRLTTVKAMTSISNSPLKIDLRVILPETLPVLSSFLRYRLIGKWIDR